MLGSLDKTHFLPLLPGWMPLQPTHTVFCTALPPLPAPTPTLLTHRCSNLSTPPYCSRTCSNSRPPSSSRTRSCPGTPLFFRTTSTTRLGLQVRSSCSRNTLPASGSGCLSRDGAELAHQGDRSLWSRTASSAGPGNETCLKLLKCKKFVGLHVPRKPTPPVRSQVQPCSLSNIPPDA